MIGILPFVCLQLLIKESMTHSSIKPMMEFMHRRLHLPENNQRDCVHTHDHNSSLSSSSLNSMENSSPCSSRSDDSQITLRSSIYTLFSGMIYDRIRGILLETNVNCNDVTADSPVIETEVVSSSVLLYYQFSDHCSKYCFRRTWCVTD